MKWKLNFVINVERNLILKPEENRHLFAAKNIEQVCVVGTEIPQPIAINLNYKRYFIQSELKGGFINMSDVRTTNNSADKASQHFFFSQVNFLIGANFRLN